MVSWAVPSGAREQQDQKGGDLLPALSHPVLHLKTLRQEMHLKSGHWPDCWQSKGCKISWSAYRQFEEDQDPSLPMEAGIHCCWILKLGQENCCNICPKKRRDHSQQSEKSPRYERRVSPSHFGSQVVLVIMQPSSPQRNKGR